MQYSTSQQPCFRTRWLDASAAAAAPAARQHLLPAQYLPCISSSTVPCRIGAAEAAIASTLQPAALQYIAAAHKQRRSTFQHGSKVEQDAQLAAAAEQNPDSSLPKQPL